MLKKLQPEILAIQVRPEAKKLSRGVILLFGMIE
jgi:hypothetical protein